MEKKLTNPFLELFFKYLKFLFCLCFISMIISLVSCTRQTSPEGAMTTAPVHIAEEPGQAHKTGGDYSLGIPECDRFFKNFEKCVMGRVPKSARQEWRIIYEKVVEEIHLQYQEKGEGVKVTCIETDQRMKAATQVYQCLWE